MPADGGRSRPCAKRCKLSGKRKYRNQVDCLLANADRPEMAYSYLCAHCRFWHLTKQEPADRVRGEQTPDSSREGEKAVE